MIGPHRFRQRLDAGRPVFGMILNVDAPWLVDTLGLTGFDFVLLDAEHGPLSPGRVEMMVRAAEAANVSPLVRVPGNVPHDILRYLDIGAVGIQVPLIETVAETRASVDAVRYPPEGNRGLATHTRASGYGAVVSPKEYMAITNRESVVLATIESKQAVELIDEIAAVPGLDVLAIGPGDMSVSMGFAGDRSAAPVQDGVKRAIAAGKKHKKWVSLPASTPAAARQCLAMGADIIQIPATNFMLEYGRQFIKDSTPG